MFSGRVGCMYIGYIPTRYVGLGDPNLTFQLHNLFVSDVKTLFQISNVSFLLRYMASAGIKSSLLKFFFRIHNSNIRVSLSDGVVWELSCSDRASIDKWVRRY